MGSYIIPGLRSTEAKFVKKLFHNPYKLIQRSSSPESSSFLSEVDSFINNSKAAAEATLTEEKRNAQGVLQTAVEGIKEQVIPAEGLAPRQGEALTRAFREVLQETTTSTATLNQVHTALDERSNQIIKDNCVRLIENNDHALVNRYVSANRGADALPNEAATVEKISNHAKSMIQKHLWSLNFENELGHIKTLAQNGGFTPEQATTINDEIKQAILEHKQNVERVVTPTRDNVKALVQDNWAAISQAQTDAKTALSGIKEVHIDYKHKATGKIGAESLGVKINVPGKKSTKLQLPKREDKNAGTYLGEYTPKVERFANLYSQPSENVSSKILKTPKKTLPSDTVLDRYENMVGIFNNPEVQHEVEDLKSKGIELKALPGSTMRFKEAPKNASRFSLIDKLRTKTTKLKLDNPDDMEASIGKSLNYGLALNSESRQFISPKLLLNNKKAVTQTGIERYNSIMGGFNSIDTDYLKLKGVSTKVLPNSKLRVVQKEGNKTLFNQKIKVDVNNAESVERGLEFADRLANRNDLNISPRLMRSPTSRQVTETGLNRYDAAAEALRNASARIEELEQDGVSVKVRHNGEIRVTKQIKNKFFTRTPYNQSFKKNSAETWPNFLNRVLTQAQRVASV